MRKPTPEQIAEKKLALAKLKIDWETINRRHVNQDLRNSLYTRILELEVEVQGMETRLHTPRRARRGERPEREKAVAQA